MFNIEKGKVYVHPNKKNSNDTLESAIKAFNNITSQDESFFIPADKVKESTTSYFISKLSKYFPEETGIKILYLKEFKQAKTPEAKPEYTGIRIWRKEFNVEKK